MYEQLGLFVEASVQTKDRVRAYMIKELALPDPVQFYMDPTGETVCALCLRRGAIYIGGLGISRANAKSVVGLIVRIPRHQKCPGELITLTGAGPNL